MKKLFILTLIILLTGCFSQGRSRFVAQTSVETQTTNSSFINTVSTLIKNQVAQYSPYVYGEKNSAQVFTKENFNVIGSNCEYNNSSCIIKLNVSKVASLRPFFMVNLNTASQNCSLPAYVKSILAIAGEIVPEVTNPQNFDMNTIFTNCAASGNGYVCNKISSSSLSIATYSSYPIIDNKTNEPVVFGNQKVVKVEFQERSTLNKVCLDNLILPSGHSSVSSERSGKNNVSVVQLELMF